MSNIHSAVVSVVPLPRVVAPSRPLLGKIALSAFLITQLLDGLCTYAGVLTFGIGVEANPVVAGLMNYMGHVPGLLSAKIAASGFGICLYLNEIHSVVALLAGVYLTAAIAPWAMILFF